MKNERRILEEHKRRSAGVFHKIVTRLAPADVGDVLGAGLRYQRDRNKCIEQSRGECAKRFLGDIRVEVFETYVVQAREQALELAFAREPGEQRGDDRPTSTGVVRLRDGLRLHSKPGKKLFELASTESEIVSAER
ncbi:MAG: hypothetical protein JO293_07385 [Candidatus Eremiobacteraeota bacterium]|nr:hypothetical protein [Candidatus Eremiobacteraeota bacterium]